MSAPSTKPPAQLRDGLLLATPREQSGAETAERYEYQIHWALDELLRRHAAGKNYCILLEYFDDVVLLDDDTDPQHAEFVQVKTKRSGHWTFSDLTKRGGKEKTELSPIGKMYAHRLSFPDASLSLHFLSNVPLKAKLTDGTSADSHPSVRCCDLPDKDALKLTEAVRTEHGLAPDAVIDLRDITAFVFCAFGPQGASTHVLGSLERFLHELFPFRKVPTTAVYHTLLAELRRRNNCRTRPESFSMLLSLHGMTRGEFERLVGRVGVHDDPESDWQAISARLVNEGWPTAEQLRIHAAWRRYLAGRTNHQDRQLQRVRMEIRRQRPACLQRDDLDLRQLVALLLAPVVASPRLTAGYSPEFLTAAALAELMTSHPDGHELSPVDPPSAPSIGSSPIEDADAHHGSGGAGRTARDASDDPDADRAGANDEPGGDA